MAVEKIKKNSEKPVRAAKRVTPNRRASKKRSDTKESSEKLSEGYNKFKEFGGKKYTGMKVGRSHKWYYNQGEWKEKKITPDKWEFSYEVIKRRAGRAPEGSGVPVGTEYHWYILADQYVEKLDANNYTTKMTGLKFKLNHKRAEKESWSTTEKTERKRLIKALEEMINHLKAQEE